MISLLYGFIQLKKREKISKEKMAVYQQKKLKEMLIYAYKNSKYYHEVFSNNGITEKNIQTKELDAFPTITKTQFLKHFDDIVTVSGVTQRQLREFDEKESNKNIRYQEKYHIVHSSGSTGTPAFFLYDENAWNTMLLGIIRAAFWEMSMLQIGKMLMEKPRILYIAATDGRYGGAMAVGDGIEGLHLQQVHLNVQRPLKEWIQEMDALNPNIIIGYPSAVKIIAELMKENQISLSLIRVITCGEPLHKSMEQLFYQCFDCPVVNVYGASESLAMGVGINKKEGITLFDDMNYIEMKENKIYLTSLYNYTQPIIRYELTDELEKLDLAEDQNPFTVVKNILGRNEDLLWFEDREGNKEFLHPLSVEGICVNGLIDYQFRQKDKESFEMYAQVEKEDNKEQIKKDIFGKMQNLLEEKKLTYVSFDLHFIDCIYPDPKTGKKKLVLSQ